MKEENLPRSPPRTRQCIYCTKIKKKSEFNAEHVIPQSFGKFENNLTLHCVCTKCNRDFGRELDEKLACDSVEAVDRIRHGIKKPSAFRTLGKRSTLHVRVTTEGPLNGAYGYYIRGLDGEKLPFTLSPQVGFGRSPDGPFEWFLLDEIPSKDEITAKGYGRELLVRFEGTSIEDAQEALVAAGYSAGSKGGEYDHKDERLKVDIYGLVGNVDCRAVTKIAFNYFAFVMGYGVALMSQFDAVRRYVLEGAQPPEKIVTVDINPGGIERISDGRQVVGHYLAFHRDGSRIVAQVSLLLRVRYVVVLSTDEFLVPRPRSFSPLNFWRRRLVFVDGGRFDWDSCSAAPRGPRRAAPPRPVQESAAPRRRPRSHRRAR